MIFTLRHEEIIIIWSNLAAAIFSQLSNEYQIILTICWSLLINMEHNLYDNDTDDYYEDDSDTLIMDLSYICNKLDDSEEENESLLE